jgi:hypothetical protein
VFCCGFFDDRINLAECWKLRSAFENESFSQVGGNDRGLFGSRHIRHCARRHDAGETKEKKKKKKKKIVFHIFGLFLQPIRTVQTSTHFKHVSGPSPIDNTVFCSDLLTPCSGGDEEAIEMKWTDVPGDKLVPPQVNTKVKTKTKKYLILLLSLVLLWN